jgi:hypothetical protein
MKRFLFSLIPVIAIVSDVFAGNLITRDDIGFG